MADVRFVIVGLFILRHNTIVYVSHLLQSYVFRTSFIPN